MPRRSWIPLPLRDGPFTLAQARAVGLDRWHLEHGPYRRLGPRTYVPKALRIETETKLRAALLRLPPIAAFSGYTAAWLAGLDVKPEPLEATVPKGTGVSARAGLRISRATLPPDDLTILNGFRATSPCRTLRDLSARLSLTEAVVLADMALHGEVVTRAELSAWIARSSGRVGIKTLRRAADLADPAAESPMETRVRVSLVLAGLPPPQVQAPVLDRGGRVVARLDLYYPQYRLGIEFDGGTHKFALVEDNRRQNLLLELGIRLLRFTTPDLSNPDVIAARVRAQMARPAA